MQINLFVRGLAHNAQKFYLISTSGIAFLKLIRGRCARIENRKTEIACGTSNSCWFLKFRRQIT